MPRWRRPSRCSRRICQPGTRRAAPPRDGTSGSSILRSPPFLEPAMRIPPRLLLVFGVLILAGPAVGSLTDHKTLTIEGRTIDPEGFPIEKVKVRLQGARHASVVSNVDGQFSLKLPIGTPNDLQIGRASCRERECGSGTRE